MQEKMKPLSADEKAVLVRLGGGERLFLTDVYKVIQSLHVNKEEIPRYYFAELGEAAKKEKVQDDLVNALRHNGYIVFPSSSDSTKYTWTEASITDLGRQVLADDNAKE